MNKIFDNNAKMADKVIYKNVYNTTSQSKSRIQSTHSMFKLIMFNDSKRDQAEKPVEDKNAIANDAYIPTNTKNYLSYK